MKRTLTTILCIFSSIAGAANWHVSYDNGEGVIEYIDTDSIKSNGNEVAATLKREYGDGIPRRETDVNDDWFVFTESKTDLTIDCATGSKTINSLVHLSEDGTHQSLPKAYPTGKILTGNPWDTAVSKYLCSKAYVK